MTLLKSVTSTLLFVFLGLSSAALVRADIVADFNSMTLGGLNSQAGWGSTGNARVILDLTNNNQLLQLVGPGSSAYKPLIDLAIPEGGTGTLFMRFQVDGNSVDHAIGLADVAAPTTWTDFESITRIYPNTPGTVKAQGRNHGTYNDLPLNGGANALSSGTWYHLWMVNDNATDTVDYYLQGGGIATQRLVGEDYGFRNGTSRPLETFTAMIGSASSSLFIDDIYAWQGVNLSSPIGAPSARAVVVGDGTGPRTEIGLNPPALFDFIGERLHQTNVYMPVGLTPERTYGGRWDTMPPSSWTSGFFSGQLWMMYRQTGDSYYLNAAKARTYDLRGQELNGSDHDVGFRVFNSFGEGYRSLPDGDPDKADYLNRIFVAADTLSTRYNPTYRAIDSWGANQVIIDNMMNLELLFWSAEKTTDPVAAQKWRNIAINQATTSQREHVRPDGSTYHVVQFNGSTGAVSNKRTAQGYADESTWSRGQAWAIYGFTMTYRFTEDASFLNTAVKVADYWLAHMPADGVVPYDFNDPAADVPLDSSASAVAASALLELMDYVDAENAQRFFKAAKTMLEGLTSLEILTNGREHHAILDEASVRRNSHHMGLAYGDYYFVEALQRFEALMIPGDFNADGFVDAADYTLLRDHEGAADESALNYNGDGGGIGPSDYAVWRDNYGASIFDSPSSPSVVPEPSCLLMAVFLSITLASGWRDRA